MTLDELSDVAANGANKAVRNAARTVKKLAKNSPRLTGKGGDL